jgi:hypothetical protein
MWTNLEQQGDHFVFTDFDNGKWEVDFNKDKKPGKEF